MKFLAPVSPTHIGHVLSHGFLKHIDYRSDGKSTVLRLDVGEQPAVEILDRQVRIQAYLPARPDRFEFRDIPVADVLERVTARLEMRYALAPDARGSFSGCLEGPDPLTVLRPLLKARGLQMKVSKHFLVVGSASQMARLTPHLEDAIYRYGGFQEVLLEHKQAKELIHGLRRRFPRIQFDLHPTLNGFYVKGAKRSILQLKSEVSSFDR